MTNSADNERPALIWCLFPDRDSAEAIAKTLLDEGRIACANIMPEIVSVFVWKGERESSMEKGGPVQDQFRPAGGGDRSIGRAPPL